MNTPRHKKQDESSETYAFVARRVEVQRPLRDSCCCPGACRTAAAAAAARPARRAISAARRSSSATRSSRAFATGRARPRRHDQRRRPPLSPSTCVAAVEPMRVAPTPRGTRATRARCTACARQTACRDFRQRRAPRGAPSGGRLRPPRTRPQCRRWNRPCRSHSRSRRPRARPNRAAFAKTAATTDTSRRKTRPLRPRAGRAPGRRKTRGADAASRVRTRRGAPARRHLRDRRRRPSEARAAAAAERRPPSGACARAAV